MGSHGGHSQEMLGTPFGVQPWAGTWPSPTRGDPESPRGSSQEGSRGWSAVPAGSVPGVGCGERGGVLGHVRKMTD